MRLSVITAILFTTLTIASPAPTAQPTAALTPLEIDARTAVHLVDRMPKTKKPKSSGGNSTNETEESAASGMLAPSRVLELGALGFGVLEVVRLWG
jgi:hypothetical protein